MNYEQRRQELQLVLEQKRSGRELIPFPKPAAPPVREPIPSRIGCVAVGIGLMAAGAVLALTSMRANAWFGYALSVDDRAGSIFSALSVTAEVIAFLMPVANRLYRQAGDYLAVVQGRVVMLVAISVVAFAASGFVLTNLSDKVALRSQASAAVVIASRALDDARITRDRECVKLGPVCRQREDAVVARQRELTHALAGAAGDPQAAALGISPTTLRLAQAGALVAMCLLAGLVLSHGWGLVFR